MTNSEQAIRELLEKHKFGYQEYVDFVFSDLTALISEHYVSKDEHEKMKHNLTHCGSCGKPLSRDCPECKHLWES